MPKPKIVIFDLDGVLVDSNKLTAEDFYNVHLNADKNLYRETLCGNFIEEVAKLAELKKPETPEEKEERLTIYRNKKKDCAIFEGIPELLRELHSCGYTICLNTSASIQSSSPSLERHELIHFFDFLGTKEVSVRKTEKFEMIKEKYNAKADEMIFITDTLGDIREADHVGVPTIAVTWGIHDRGYFDREPHDNLIGIVDSVAELREKIML